MSIRFFNVHGGHPPKKMTGLRQQNPARANWQARSRSVFRAASWQAVLLALLFAVASKAADFVIAVDVSGSMSNPVGPRDKRVRLTIVQDGLKQYLPSLPLGTRIDLIAFNSGIVSEKEVILKDGPDRAQVLAWVDGLAQLPRKSNRTFLWTTLRHAFQTASQYSRDNPTEPVTVRVLTDGEDNEGVTTFDKVVEEFLPLLDGRKIRGNLVLLGDLEFKTKLPLPEGAFETITDPEWEVLFPPILLWAPVVPQVGDEVRLFENNTRSIYRDYEWQVDGTTVGREKVLTWRFTEARAHKVTLKVTGLKGSKAFTTTLLNPKGRRDLAVPRSTSFWWGFVAIPFLCLAAAAAFLIHNRRGKALRLPVYYWAERSLVCRTVVLTEAEQEVDLRPAAPIRLRRVGKSQDVLVQPTEGATLLDSSGEVTPARSIGAGVRIIVKPSSGPALAVAISSRQRPTCPTPAASEPETPPGGGVCGLLYNSEPGIPGEQDDFDWGWTTTSGTKIG